MSDFAPQSGSKPGLASGPSSDYDKRQARERLRTVLIGLTIGCALSAMLLFARSAMKPPAPADPAKAVTPTATPTLPLSP